MNIERIDIHHFRSGLLPFGPHRLVRQVGRWRWLGNRRLRWRWQWILPGCWRQKDAPRRYLGRSVSSCRPEALTSTSNLRERKQERTLHYGFGETKPAKWVIDMWCKRNCPSTAQFIIWTIYNMKIMYMRNQNSYLVVHGNRYRPYINCYKLLNYYF